MYVCCVGQISSRFGSLLDRLGRLLGRLGRLLGALERLSGALGRGGGTPQGRAKSKKADEKRVLEKRLPFDE